MANYRLDFIFQFFGVTIIMLNTFLKSMVIKQIKSEETISLELYSWQQCF